MCQVKTPEPQIPDVLVFERGCSAETRLLVMASFHHNSHSERGFIKTRESSFYIYIVIILYFILYNILYYIL